MTTAPEPANVNPERIFETLNAYQKTAALKTAIDLDVFSAIAAGSTTHESIAQRCQTSERGMRILCDYLIINGFLLKNGQEYSLADDSAIFLDRRSPAYMGAAAQLSRAAGNDQSLSGSHRHRPHRHLVKGEKSTAEPDSSKWVEFARSMGNVAAHDAQQPLRKRSEPAPAKNGKCWTSQQATACTASSSPNKIPTRKFSPWIGRKY